MLDRPNSLVKFRSCWQFTKDFDSFLKCKMNAYAVGSNICIKEKDQFIRGKIVKVCKSEEYNNNNAAILVQCGNEFLYTMVDDCENTNKRARDSDNSETSSTSTKLSANKWHKHQMWKRYKYAIHEDRSYLSFFGEEKPKDVPSELAGILKANEFNVINDQDKKLIPKEMLPFAQAVDNFELTFSEASVRQVVTAILNLLDVFTIDECSSKFGKIDMIAGGSSGIYSLVIENECGSSPCYKSFFDNRDQLMAYMISIALENFAYVKSEKNIEIESQEIIGILHCGLSPFFFKTKISKAYLIWLENDLRSSTSNETCPELNFSFYQPFENPYNNHELLKNRSASNILKCYGSLLKLEKNYTARILNFVNEKMTKMLVAPQN